jgi:hypothetical protein
MAFFWHNRAHLSRSNPGCQEAAKNVGVDVRRLSKKDLHITVSWPTPTGG